MQAIVTKFIPATEKNGNRYQAKSSAGRLVIDQRGDGAMMNHRTAAMALAHRLGWGGYGTWYAGGMPDGSVVWVCDGRNSGGTQDAHKFNMTDPRGQMPLEMR